MKKLLVMVVLMVYGMAALGVTVQAHYCCGKLKKFGLVPQKKDCHQENQNQAAYCCVDKVIKTVADEDNVIFGSSTFLKWQGAVLQNDHLFRFIYDVAKENVPLYLAQPPPAEGLIHLYCTYRI